MLQPISELREKADQLLAAGVRVPEVEAQLIRAGLSGDQAARVIDEALAVRLAQSPATPTTRPLRWTRLAAGFTLAVAGFAVAYFFAWVWSDDVPDGRVIPASGRVLAVPGGAVAVLGLNMMRGEFMAWWRSEA